jgi:hypothetical protein
MANNAAERIVMCRVCCTERGPFKSCGKCHLAWYCSKQCQRSDWTKITGGHAVECPVMQRLYCRREQIYIGDIMGEPVYAPVGNAMSEALWNGAYCLDCVHNTGNANRSHYFCDGCEKPFICNQCEARYQFCRDCRGAAVARRQPNVA